MQFRALDDERKPRVKHAERLTEINKSRNVAVFWLYSENANRIASNKERHENFEFKVTCKIKVMALLEGIC